MNFLLFTSNIAEIRIQERQCLFHSASNRLTAFYIDLTEYQFINTDLSAITITLKGKNDIDFKTHVQSGELFTQNGILYYKNTKPFSSISGEYYLEITDGTNIIYSNYILFNSLNDVVLESDYFKMYFNSGSITIVLDGSGSSIIDFGDGNTQIVSLPTTITHTNR